MVLQKIQAGIAEYLQYLSSLKYHPHLYKWESVKHFQEHWKQDTDNPAAMFDRCFYNAENRRLWQSDHWEPKRMMTLFWKTDPLTCRWMFDDLFNETRDLEGRVNRFLFGCDELLRDYKRNHSNTNENNHYHGDFRMIALYLAFRYPESYAPYDFQSFQKTMERLGARDIPLQNDYPRYIKVLRTLSSFLDKEPRLEQHLRRLLQARHYQGKTLFLAEDFCVFLGGKRD